MIYMKILNYYIDWSSSRRRAVPSDARQATQITLLFLSTGSARVPENKLFHKML